MISVKILIAQVNKFHLLLMTNFPTPKNYLLNKKSYSDITKVQMTKQLLCNLKAVFPIKWCASLPLFCKNSMCNVCAYCWQDFKCVCSMGFIFFISQKFYIKYLESYKQRECLLSDRIWTFKILIINGMYTTCVHKSLVLSKKVISIQLLQISQPWLKCNSGYFWKHWKHRIQKCYLTFLKS